MSTLSQIRDVVLVGCDEVADGVRRLRLRAADGGLLPTWEPGAHLDLLLPSGLVRQYSLCGSPGIRDEYELAVLKEPVGRGGSAEVHEELSEGDQLRIAGPRNRFDLVDSPGYLFVAGGIGITPILPMIENAERRGVRWRLVYGGRTRATMAFLDRLGAYGDRVDVRPQDEFGLLDLATLARAEPDTIVYCCGPEPLLAAMEDHCARQWPRGSLRVERFVAGEAVEAVGDDAGAFEVQLGEGGPLIEIPADQSILHTLLDAGVDALYSCEEGTCGSCETQVLSGTPDHRDELLSDETRAQGCMLICVSRSRGERLVLDLDPPDDLVVHDRDSA